MLCSPPAQSETDPLQQWPNWRGPLQTGEAPQADPPIQWSETEGVRWKTPLPGLGHSSPIAWEDTIFLTATVPIGDPLEEPRWSGRPGAHNNLPVTSRHQFLVLAVDRSTGKIRWQTAVHEALPEEGGHETGSLASASPVTDGTHVYAFFGSHGLYALDLDGTVVWQRDLGQMKTKHGHGEGASPALWGDTLVVNWDHEGISFLAAFDAKSGKPRWRKLRDEGTSWSTPVIVLEDGKPQVVVSATGAVRGYDLDTGEVLWQASGLSANVVASPVVARGFVYAMSSYTFQAGMAIRLEGAQGQLDETDHIVWRRARRTPYIPTPLYLNGFLYVLSHYQGVLSRIEAESGAEPTGPVRLGSLREIYASPVAAGGRIYFTDRSGAVLVLSDEPEPRALALNHLEDQISATPALIGGDILIRGEEFLYAIGPAL